IGALISGALTAVSFVAPASAQATRTWVSGTGDDVNPCSRTAPCKTFAGAISKTANPGEINCLDPAGYGAVSINSRSLSILCSYTEGGIASANTNGVNVTAGATDKVFLEGLDIDGTGTGINGIRMLGTGKLTISKSRIRNHTNYGVDLEGTANARVFITDSIISGNGTGGFLIQGPGGVANNGILDHTTIDSNGAAAVKVAAGGTLTVSNSVLTGSTVAIDPTGGGTVTSYGTSVIRPAATINTPLPEQ
ncbi:MAG TPA: right-handed parallel beta-helix repeat-containing protein, partial [Bradyrhizobium sp.]|nr:right-handed parallel beta-helix repeat-containing protein [Bradyrhizobium sp.]